MNVLQKIFELCSKGFDLSSKMTKDDDIKVILVGVSAIFTLAVGAVKIYKNILSVKRLLRISKKEV